VVLRWCQCTAPERETASRHHTPERLVGSQFDIHSRVIDQATSAVVLESGCYTFTISL
jgi:hypothetical protein